MTQSTPENLILITGATGYVGRHVVRQVKAAGFNVRALVRSHSNRNPLAGLVDEFHVGNVIDGQSIEGSCEDCVGVIHLVGVINQKQGSMEEIHVKGTDHILGEAKRAEVKRFIYLSGLGTRKDSIARYHKTKYAAEQAVLNSGLEGYCFPTSVIFGEDDEFLNLFIEMARSYSNPPWPLMPLIGGGQSYRQPIWIEDVAACLTQCLSDTFPLQPGTYELGGPEALTMEEIMRIACKAAQTSRFFISVPIFVAKIIAFFMENFTQKPKLTKDLLIMIQEDGRAKNNMTEKILGRPARKMWDYICTRYDLPYTKRLLVGSGTYQNRVRPQEGIVWRATKDA